jgi:FkbM family methyltransferase
MNIEFYCYDKFVKKGDVVYDIGAHEGEMSINFLSRGVKTVYAFEPSQLNLPKLKENTARYDSIKICDVALHEKEYSCVTRFRDCKRGAPLDQEQNINYVILENYINKNNLELPNFIKMDIEGMESIVLKGFDFLFLEKRPIIFVEIHAAPKDEKQNYVDNPHWIWPEDGGFDFNTLKKYNYCYINENAEIVDYSINFNPLPRQHKGCILVPIEKLK